MEEEGRVLRCWECGATSAKLFVDYEGVSVHDWIKVIKSGNYLKAVKQFRKETGTDLLPSKEIADFIREKLCKE